MVWHAKLVENLKKQTNSKSLITTRNSLNTNGIADRIILSVIW
jgi:hypothetical protein